MLIYCLNYGLHKYVREIAMKKSFSKLNISLCMAFIAVILVCIIFSSVGIVYAETRARNDLNIVHISDLHYYPTYMCYKESNGDYSNSSINEKSKFESKLLTESSAVIKKLFNNIYDVAPDYLFVTGDLSSDGEKFALMEIANGLRDLQNRIREKGNEQFQIFVIPGNHDILNANATDYSTVGGASAEDVTREEFVKIFAGLGYPNISAEQAKIVYSDYYDFISKCDEYSVEYLPYDTESGEYVESKLAENIDIKWTPNLTAGESLAEGDLSYYVNCGDSFTLLAIDGLVTGKVGGKVSDGVLKWFDDEKGNYTKNIMSISHQNVIPHFTMQEQWTKNYLYSNWQTVRDKLLNLGVRYNFSGHMHANDVASYCNYNNRTLYDVETGSPVGYGANYRQAKISFYQDGASDMELTLQEITNIDISLLVDNGYIDNSNLKFVRNKEIIDLPEYIDEKLYDNMLIGVLDSVIKFVDKENFVNMVFNYIKKQGDSGIAKLAIEDNADALKEVIEIFYNQIQAKTLSDFVYTGNKPYLQGENNKLRAYLYSVAEQLFSLEIRDGYTIQNMFVDAYTTHLKGGENTNIAGLNESLQYAIESWMPSGEMVRDIVDMFRSGDNSLAKFINKVLTTDYNLTTGLLYKYQRGLNPIMSYLDTDLEKFNLDKVIRKLAGDKLNSLPSEFVNKQLDYIVTQSIASGVGENIGNVIRSLVTDSSYDGVVGVPTKVLYYSGDRFTHYPIGDEPVRNPSITDGRLPSMLNMTFGKNNAVDRNIVWFTDKSVTGTDIFISEGDRSSFDPKDIGNIEADCQIIKVDKPLADIGIMTTYSTMELARHTIKITGLKPNTMYTYYVGDYSRRSYSDYQTFVTGNGNERTPFEILITTDMQGMSQSAYQNSAKLLDASMRVSKIGYDFMLSLGDMVDSGKNINQWNYLLNSNSKFFGGTPQVVVSGNHDISVKDGKIDTASGMSPVELIYGYKDSYYSFDYNGVHFIVLDTNNFESNQYLWLEGDLKQNKDKLVVVAMHKGIYSAGPHRNDSEIVSMRKSLTELFSEYKVELVLQGHDHVYSESFFLDSTGKRLKTPPYKQGSPINNNNGGVLYVTMGVSGDKFYDFDSNTNDIINKGKMYHSPKLNNPTFGKLTFDGENISLSSYQYDIARDRVEQLVMFNNNTIFLMVSIITAVVILAGIFIMIILLLRSHKKKIEKCKNEDWSDSSQNNNIDDAVYTTNSVNKNASGD